MESTFPSHIFRSYNIRGLLHEVTPEIAKKAGMILVAMTGAKTVVVGRDMRETSPELMKAAIEGVTSMGANVLNIGLCTSSMYNYAVTSSEAIGAGIMITASHNPSEYNGIKMAKADGSPIAGSEILKRFEDAMAPADVAGTETSHDVLKAYLDRCVDQSGVTGSKAKIVIDYGNGMGALSMRPLCERLGLEVTELYADPDARFPNHEANPAKEETLEDLKKKVLELGADFGVATDGDADRVAFVDNEGKSLAGDCTLALLTKDVLANHPGGKVLYSINAGWALEDAIRAHGGEPVQCPVGNTKIIQKMHELGGVLGGEVSSHFFFPEFHNLEAIDFAFLKVLKAWQTSGTSFADMIRPFRSYANSAEINLHVKEGDAAIAAVKARYESAASNVIAIDGLRFEFAHDWWFLVRKSNTEPLIRITVEAKNETMMMKERDALVALVENL
jgi:phosphomannomutase